ncbi:MAG: 4Fe-4S binding protein [bacterium]
MYKVNKEKCIGCGVCEANCPEGAKLVEDGKAEIINQDKIKECGGEDLCPYGAIEEIKK